MATENKVGAFMDAHDHELVALRLPREGMTVERYEAKLAELDAELDAPSQEAYSAAWKDRMAFVANYGPDTWIGSITPEPEPDPEPELGI
jgi:hypothetical protein